MGNSRVPATTGGKQASKKANTTSFKPGQSGNPKGRPPGSRNKITEDFLSAVAADFGKYGVAVVKQVREEKPVAYLEMVAALVPKNVNLEHSGDEAFVSLWKALAQGAPKA